MNEKSMKFEAAIERLEQIVKRMEQGNAALEESLDLFEEGTRLIKLCSKQLDEAEFKVSKLSKGEDGTPTETELKGEC